MFLTVQMYTAGISSADLETVAKSAAITAMIFALLSAIAVLILNRRKK